MDKNGKDKLSKLLSAMKAAITQSKQREIDQKKKMYDKLLLLEKIKLN